jgi:hypothetical protein
MTLKDLDTIIIDEETNVEELPAEVFLDEAIAEEAVERVIKEMAVRHLAQGDTGVTLCGVVRDGVETAHPSKSRKTDCAKCRAEVAKLRKAKKTAEPAKPEPVVEPVKPEPTATKPAKPEPTKRQPRWRPTHEEVSRVRQLAGQGIGLEEIERQMGWPTTDHGRRPWGILHGKTVPRD